MALHGSQEEPGRKDQRAGREWGSSASQGVPAKPSEPPPGILRERLPGPSITLGLTQHLIFSGSKEGRGSRKTLDPRAAPEACCTQHWAGLPTGLTQRLCAGSQGPASQDGQQRGLRDGAPKRVT